VARFSVAETSGQIFRPKSVTAKQGAAAQQFVDQAITAVRVNVGRATLRAGWSRNWRYRVDPTNKGATDPFAKPKYSEIRTIAEPNLRIQSSLMRILRNSSGKP
jgi:hypothetical protein